MNRSRLLRPVQEFFRLEASSGILLLVSAASALLWANSPLRESYRVVWQVSVGGMSLSHWVNDGLMAFFFLLVGLEIKREVLHGELKSRQNAALPAAAALGGMLVPAIIYASVNKGGVGILGWGIPMATDIAFALGVLKLLGKRVPPGLKVFLTALAIVDDLGAVLVIAFFYTAQISWVHLLGAAGVFGVLIALDRLKIFQLGVYGLLGCVLWVCLLRSGVHATIAGVLLALIIPARPAKHLEQSLHPWVSFGVVPVFALANAGVALTGGSFAHPISLGIVAGLVLGKQIGVTLFSWVAVKLKFAQLPDRTSWRQVYGVACLSGIGFTMSLFVTALAFGGSESAAIAKQGILAASILAGAWGTLVLAMRVRDR